VSSPFKGRADRADKQRSVELEPACQHEQVVEVLHPAVRSAELHDGIELLGHDGFARIDPRIGPTASEPTSNTTPSSATSSAINSAKMSRIRSFARIPNAEQADVAGGAMRMAGPQREQRRAFEDEAPLVSRPRQSVEQALVRVPGEQELEVVAMLASEVKQPRTNRRADVFRWLHHASASR
jgi:hypothetical protein